MKYIKTCVKRFVKRCLRHELYFYSIVNRNDAVINARLELSREHLQMKLANSKPLTTQQKADITNFWNRYFRNKPFLFDLNQYSLYNNYNLAGENLKFYVPDDFYMGFVDTFFSDYASSIVFDNKNLYDLYFAGVKMPKTIVRKQNGLYLDAAYRPVTKEKACELCIGASTVIFKDSIDSDSGVGCRFWNHTESVASLEEIMDASNNYIVQEIVKQHADIAAFNHCAVNTIRIITLFFNGKPIVLSSMLRMSTNSAKVDNFHAGGIACGINSDGTLKDVAYDVLAHQYAVHPMGKMFAGFRVPSYDKCVAMVSDLSLRFVNISQLISWDIAIDEDGEPVLIEANFTGGGVDSLQLCNGPLFGQYTEKVMDYLFANSPLLKAYFAE